MGVHVTSFLVIYAKFLSYFISEYSGSLTISSLGIVLSSTVLVSCGVSYLSPSIAKVVV